jgi:rRNA processing protein Gar1
LNRLGRVLHYTPNHLWVVRAENPASPGTVALDRKLKPVGTVQELIGPVKQPYLTVKPTVPNPAGYAGQTLYAENKPGK